MRAPITINGIVLRFLSLRDWSDLSAKWLAARQHEHEQSLRRAGASAVEIAQAVQEYAAKRSAYGLLLEMCKTWDGCVLILERAAGNSGIRADDLHAALEGLDPDAVAVLAMRACGWEIKPQGESGNA